MDSAIFSEPVFWILIAILAILILVTIYMMIRLMFRRREDHVGTYFEGNFRTIMSEWDLINRPTLKLWKSEASKRLKMIEKDVTGIEKMRTTIDNRLSTLDREIMKMERF
jgi:hypothetical protein